MPNRLLPRRLRDWLHRLDPGYRWLQEEVQARDRQIQELHHLPIPESLHRLTVYADMSDEDFRTLDDKGLFIVGNARSGTAILCDCFNLSKDVFMLGEAHLFLQHNLGDFAGHFNLQHAMFQKRRGKGTFLPPPLTTEAGGLAALKRMGTYYRYVGEKIAFGAIRRIDDRTVQEVFLAFHARYFYGSKYFLIMRKPAETVWSMTKMFPDAPPQELLACWLNTVKVQLDLVHAFPHVYVIFFENLTAETFVTINAILGTDIQPGPNTLRDDKKLSSLSGDQWPPELAAYRALGERCSTIYHQLQEAFCPKTLILKDTVSRAVCTRGGFSAAVHEQIDALLAELA